MCDSRGTLGTAVAGRSERKPPGCVPCMHDSLVPSAGSTATSQGIGLPCAAGILDSRANMTAQDDRKARASCMVCRLRLESWEVGDWVQAPEARILVVSPCELFIPALWSMFSLPVPLNLYFLMSRQKASQGCVFTYDAVRAHDHNCARNDFPSFTSLSDIVSLVPQRRLRLSARCPFDSSGYRRILLMLLMNIAARRASQSQYAGPSADCVSLRAHREVLQRGERPAAFYFSRRINVAEFILRWMRR